jgi:Cation/multidrug efflux pump
VGNPTILATLAVVAAILPMAFIRGMSGPYMRPIPVGASAAMVFSLVVAFVVTPWAAVRLLKPPRITITARRSPHAALSPRDGAAHRQRPEARDLPGGRGGLAAGRGRASSRSNW